MYQSSIYICISWCSKTCWFPVKKCWFFEHADIILVFLGTKILQLLLNVSSYCAIQGNEQNIEPIALLINFNWSFDYRHTWRHIFLKIKGKFQETIAQRKKTYDLKNSNWVLLNMFQHIIKEKLIQSFLSMNVSFGWEEKLSKIGYEHFLGAMLLKSISVSKEI